MRLLSRAAVVIAVLAGTACDLTLTTPSTTVSFSQTDVKVGSGTAAAAGLTLSVNYTGWLYDPSQPGNKGAQFDASAAGSPFVFTLGVGQVITGWDQGIAGMQPGGIRRLIIPPSMAYGGSRHGIIPPNATLMFDIELVSVQ